MKKLTAAASILAFALSACQPAGGPTSGGDGGEGPIKIGYIGPLTGDFASAGADTLHAVEMRVNEVNEAGGINGRPVKLIAEDGRCTGNDAASAARKLVNVDQVTAIVGGLCSGETLAAAPIAESAQVPMVSPTSTSPDVTDAGDFVFRTIPSDALKTQLMAQYFDEEGYEKVAIISENTDYATALRNALVQEVGEDRVVFNETVAPGTKDFRTLMTRLAGMDFDVFVPNGQTDSTVATMMQQLREQGIDQPTLGQDVADSATIAKIAGEAVEGLRLINTSSQLGEGGEDSFASRFRAKHGDPQSNMSFTTLAYDAAGVLFEAVAQAGADGPAIRDYLYNLDSYNGAAGSFHFDENGDVVGIPYKLKEFRDGKIVEVRDMTLE